jgi:hypothetical protein
MDLEQAFVTHTIQGRHADRKPLTTPLHLERIAHGNSNEPLVRIVSLLLALLLLCVLCALLVFLALLTLACRFDLGGVHLGRHCLQYRHGGA